MSVTFGRLLLDDPDSFPEAVGESVARVGATPVPGGRSGLSVSPALSSWADTVAQRQRVRRQMRSLVNNLPMRLAGVYLLWSDDTEQSGWYVPGTSTFDLQGIKIDSAVWKFSGEMALVGRPRTHRRAVIAYLRDRRVATEARDYLRRVYSSDFAALTPLSLTWLPSSVNDLTISLFPSSPVTSPRTGYDASSLVAVIGAPDLALISFEQPETNRNLGDVVVYDRRGATAAPTSGPNASWEEVYGPDWPWYDDEDDAPVLENSLCRVRYDAASTPGFRIDRWTGSAWAEQGKVLIERVGDSTGYLDSLIHADLSEWAPDRAVVRLVMARSADAYARDEVYITLQAGWNGPRFEVYPAAKSSGAKAGAGVHLFRAGAPSGTETANKYDGSLQSATGSPNFTPGAVGAATFTGENWIVMRRSGVNALVLAGLQAGSAGRIEASSSAYGSARNGISIRSASTAGYVSAQVGMNAASTTDAIDSVNGLKDGARDLGKEILVDSRSPQSIVSR